MKKTFILLAIALVTISCTSTREVWRHQNFSNSAFVADKAYCESNNQKNVKTQVRTHCETESKPSVGMTMRTGIFRHHFMPSRKSETNCTTTGGDIIQVLDYSGYVWCMEIKGYRLIKQYKNKNGNWIDR